MGILDVPSYSKAQSDAKYAGLNKVLPGRYTLPKRTYTDSLQSLSVMTNPPTITQTTAAIITNSVLVYPGTATGTGTGFSRLFDASKSPYFLYHGNVMKSAGTTAPDYTAVQGSLNNGYPFDGGAYSVEFDYDGSQFEIAYKDAASTNKGMIFIDGQPVNSSYVSFGPSGAGGTYRNLVKFVDPTFTPLVVTAATSVASTSTSTVTYTVTNPNSTLSVGDVVSITGLTTSSLNLSGVTVASVTGTTTFTVKISGSLTASVTGQTASVAKEVRTTRRVVIAFSAPVPFYGIYRQPTASIYKPPSKVTSILWQGDSFTEGTGSTTVLKDGYATLTSKLLGVDEIFNVAQGGTGFLAISDTQSQAANLTTNITASSTTATVDNIVNFGGAAVTAVSGSSGVVTYTFSNSNNLYTVGQTVSITGLTATQFNLPGQVITSVSTTQFTISNGATGSATGQSGKALIYPFNAFIGAEYVTVNYSPGNNILLTRGVNYGSLPTTAEAHYAGDSVVRGSRPIFRARNVTDLSKLTKVPDIIVVAGGHNDLNFDSTRLATEILTYFRSIRALFPTSIIIGLSTLPSFGVESLNVNWYKATDAIKTAMADSQVNGIFINLLELPLRYTPASTTLSSNYTYSTSSSNIVTTNYISVGATVDLGNIYGTWGGRRVVTAISGSGPYTLTLNKYPDISLTSGTTVTEVGPCIFTGTGYITSQNNSGNTDFMIISDGAHPSPEGHRLLAEEIANQIINTQITTRL
jgi:lysophospholipase L1-like esterase